VSVSVAIVCRPNRPLNRAAHLPGCPPQPSPFCLGPIPALAGRLSHPTSPLWGPRTLFWKRISTSSGSDVGSFFSSSYTSPKASEMYFRNNRPRTTCLYSAASTLLRSCRQLARAFSRNLDWLRWTGCCCCSCEPLNHHVPGSLRTPECKSGQDIITVFPLSLDKLESMRTG